MPIFSDLSSALSGSSFLGKEPNIVPGNVSPTYDGDHSAERFLDSSRNDRAFYCATACGGKVVRSTKGEDGARRQTVRHADVQTSDARRALRTFGERPLQSYMAASFDKTIQPRPWRERKTEISCLRQLSPFGALRHHLSPASGGTTNRREAFPS